MPSFFIAKCPQTQQKVDCQNRFVLGNYFLLFIYQIDNQVDKTYLRQHALKKKTGLGSGDVLCPGLSKKSFSW